MKTLKFPILLLSVIIWSNNLSGQALHFSQTFYSPLNLNPALTGVIDANWRLISNVRSQGTYFSQPLNTISLSFDKYIETQNAKIGVGVLYNHDSSFGLTIPSDQFYVSGSGITRISENSYAAGGIQLGFVWRRISYNGLTFPEQYDRNIGKYNSQLPFSENFTKESELYPDINAGVLWWMQKSKTKVMMGLSVNHISNPGDHFLEELNKVGIRTNIHSSLEYLVSEIWYIQSQVYYTRQNKASELLLGGLVGMKVQYSKIEQLKGLSMGLYVRNSFYEEPESVIVSIGTNFNNWTTFISTDLDISGLKTNGMFANAIELSLIYHRPFAVLKKFTLPCIRY